MELLHKLAVGFGVALTPANLVFALAGALIGSLIAVRPGIGPIATIAMLLPLTFHLEPTSGLIMLAGIFYGAQYGGSTTAILVNLPGETSSVVTCIDGHQMARQGRAGAALAVAALGSFFAGCVSTALIATFAPPLAKVGQSFGAPEYFSLMLLGLIAAVVLAHGSVIKAVAMIVLGLLVGLVGTDGNTGGTRFTFGITELTVGIDSATLAIGVFSIGEIITNLAQPQETRGLAAKKISRLWPTREDFRRAWPAVLRGTALGSVLGVLPGGGATLSAFAAYALEKRSSRNAAEFGRGAAVLLAAFFGVLGYVFTRLECEPAPMILGFVLGPLMEENLRRAMRISSGDPAIFIERPISLGLLIAALALCVLVALPAIRSKREEAFQE